LAKNLAKMPFLTLFGQKFVKIAQNFRRKAPEGKIWAFLGG
jgi:hypothetical protein